MRNTTVALAISSFVQSESARRRWMITRSARSAVVANLLQMTDLCGNDETSPLIGVSLMEFRYPKSYGNVVL